MASSIEGPECLPGVACTNRKFWTSDKMKRKDAKSIKKRMEDATAKVQSMSWTQLSNHWQTSYRKIQNSLLWRSVFIKLQQRLGCLRYWPICRRCCRVLAAKKQEQTWEISTWLSKHCEPAMKSCECHCLSHVMSWCVASKKTPVHFRCPPVLIFQKVFFHPDLPHLPPQQSNCGQNI